MVGDVHPLVILQGGIRLAPFLLKIAERKQGLGGDFTTPVLGGRHLLEDLFGLVKFSELHECPAFAKGDIGKFCIRIGLFDRIVEPPDRLGGLVLGQRRFPHAAVSVFQQVTLGKRLQQLLEEGFGFVRFPLLQGDLTALGKEHRAELIRLEVAVDRGHHFFLTFRLLGETRQLGLAVPQSRQGKRGITGVFLIKITRKIRLGIIGRQRCRGGTGRGRRVRVRGGCGSGSGYGAILGDKRGTGALRT